MQDLAGPALVMGRAQVGPLEFHEMRSGQSISVPVDAATSAFRAWLPEGEYEAQGKSLTVLPSATYDLDLLRGHDFDFSLSSKTDGALVLTDYGFYLNTSVRSSHRVRP